MVSCRESQVHSLIVLAGAISREWISNVDPYEQSPGLFV